MKGDLGTRLGLRTFSATVTVSIALFVFTPPWGCDRSHPPPPPALTTSARVGLREPVPAPAAAAPKVALLVTQGDRTTLTLQPVDATKPAATSLEFRHRAGSVVGKLISTQPLAAMVVVTPDVPNRSWAGILFRLEQGQGVRQIATGLAGDAAPAALGNGRVFVARGTSGPSHGSAMREDTISVDEIEASGRQIAPTSVYSVRAYMADPVGGVGNELLIHVKTRSSEQIVGVDLASQKGRTIVNCDSARDISIDPTSERMIFTSTDGQTNGWRAHQVDVMTGADTPLVSAINPDILPRAWPGDGVVFNAAKAKGLSRWVDGRTEVLTHALGDGVYEVAAFSTDGVWAVGRYKSGAATSIFSFRTDSRNISAVPTPPADDVTIVGLLP